MFETLGRIDWRMLSHSHGPATETPRLLKALAYGSAEEQNDALIDLWGFYVHQGSRYEASPYLVPFLFEVLEHADFRAKHEVIDLLLGLAVGYGESFLPGGYDVDEELRKRERGQCDCLFLAKEDKECYFAVRDRAAAFAEYLPPELDAETRLSAGFTLAHFAAAVGHCTARVKALLLKEGDTFQRVNLILTLGVLERHSAGASDLECVSSCLSGSEPRIVRLASAIAICTVEGPQAPEEAIATLVSALEEGWQFEVPRHRWTWWNEGDLLGYAALVFRLLGDERKREMIRALCAALQHVPKMNFAIPKVLLELLFPEPCAAQGRIVASLSELQKDALRVLIRSGQWTTWLLDSHITPEGAVGDAYRRHYDAFLKDLFGVQSNRYRSQRLTHSGNVSSWDLEDNWP